MKKRLLLTALVASLVLSLFCALAICTYAAPRPSRNIEITVEVTNAADFKVGSYKNTATPSFEVTCSGMLNTDMGRVNVTAAAENGRAQGTYFNGKFTTDILVSANSEMGPVMLPMPEQLETQGIKFIVNGTEVEPQRIEWREDGYFIRDVELTADVSGRTLYDIVIDEDTIPDGCKIYNNIVPGYDGNDYVFGVTRAEAGAVIPLQFYPAGHNDDVYSIENYTVNGTELPLEGEYFEPTYFTMPEGNVTIGANVTDNYAGAQHIEEIDIIFDIDDEDVFYGRRLPTVEEFMSYVKSIETSIPGVKVSIVDAEAKCLEGKEGYLPSVHNFHTVLWLEVEEGYYFGDPRLSRDYTDDISNSEFDRFFDTEFDLKVNGVEVAYAYGTEPYSPAYCDGVFVGEYYNSGPNESRSTSDGLRPL